MREMLCKLFTEIEGTQSIAPGSRNSGWSSGERGQICRAEDSGLLS